MVMADFLGLAVDEHEARCIARMDWFLSDQSRGEIIVKVGKQHDAYDSMEG